MKNEKSLFLESFYFLKSAISIFNSRCSCEQIEFTFTFKNKYSSKQEPKFSCIFISDILGIKTFEGETKEVFDNVIKYCFDRAFEITQSLLLNKEEWFSDKPDVVDRIGHLFFEMDSWKQLYLLRKNDDE